MSNMFGLWANKPSTPKRTSTLKPAPLAPKLTTTSTTSASASASNASTNARTATYPYPSVPTPVPSASHPTAIPSQYPPHLAQETQWEHVRHMGSPSSPDEDMYVDLNNDENDEDDEEEEGTLEHLGYSQLDGERPPVTRGAPIPASSLAPPIPAKGPSPSAPALIAPLLAPPAPPPTLSSASAQAQAHAQAMFAISPVQWQEEMVKLRQQAEAALAAQRKAESDRERWERKVMELRSRDRDSNNKDGSSHKSRRGERERERDRDPGVASMVEALKEENEKLKTMVQRQAQQLDATREETKQGRAQSQAEVDRLKRELDAARATHKEEIEKFKTMVQRQTQQLEEMKQARATHKEEIEKFKTMVQRQTHQLEEMKQARAQTQAAEADKLKRELDAARATHKEEIDATRMSLQEHVQRVEHLTADRERVRKERETLRGSLGAEIEQLKLAQGREIEQFKAAFEEVNADRAQAHTELRKVRMSLDGYAPKLEDSLREINTLRRELSSSRESGRAVADLKQRLAVQSGELRAARDESSALKKEFIQLVTLLEDRTSELKGAQSFLTTADAFSGVEVTNTLQRLNAEVLQSTAFMAESMVEQFLHEMKPQASKTDEQLAACKRASTAIGGSIVHFLGTKKHKDDPILIQIAFQAYLTYHLRWITCAWIIGGEECHNQFVDAIYQSVHEKEAQAIAGRWRALTRAHVPSTPLDDAQLAYQISTKIVSGLSDILLTTGCTAPKSDVSTALSSKFSDKLSFLISMAMRVNKIVGEDVTSGDFEVLAVPPGTAFDGGMMEDSYDDGASSASKGKGGNVPPTRVLCATDLGLRKKTRVATTGEREKQWETKVLLKPKVALESVIDILDE